VRQVVQRRERDEWLLVEEAVAKEEEESPRETFDDWDSVKKRHDMSNKGQKRKRKSSYGLLFFSEERLTNKEI
jgi:hypothetical protein